MTTIIVALSLVLQPIIDREGHHAKYTDFGCADPLYCEEFTGTYAYADPAEYLLDNVTCDAKWAPYKCGPEYPLVNDLEM